MKLSDILKAEHGTAIPPRRESPAIRLPEEMAPPQDSHAAFVEKIETEKRIRAEIEKEFEAKLLRLKEDLEKQLRERTEEEHRRFAEREDSFRRDADKLEMRARQAEQEKSLYESFQRKMEEQMNARLDQERKNIQENLSKDLRQAQASIDELSRLLRVKDQEIQLLKMTEVASAAASSPATPPVLPEPKTDSSQQVSAEKMKDSLTIPPPVLPVQVSTKEPEPIFFETDPASDRKAHLLRDELVAESHRLFDQLQKSERIDMTLIQDIVNRLLDSIAQRDPEYLNLVLEPYPTEHAFDYHVANCCMLSLILAQEFEFSRIDKLDLGLAALFHDVGLLNVKEDLNYPKQLTPHLQQEVLNHPARGADLMKDYLSPSACMGILHHHEIGNGKGYPKGLSGSDIHLYGHIIHIADSFEALVHERPYRKQPLEVNEAMKQLIDSGRNIYDRSVLKALMVRIGLYPVMSYVELNNKKIARVLRQNREFPLSPLISIEFDENGLKLKQPHRIDLSTTQFIHITGQVKKDLTETFPRSHFAAVEAEHKTDIAELLKNVIPVALILAVILMVLYAVIKI